MARDEKLDLLKRVPLFASCGRHQIERVGMLADEVDLPKGRVLMQQGERGEEMFVLIDGAADIRRNGHQIARAGPGEFFGEIALLDGGPRTATVELAEDSRLLVVSRRDFQSLVNEFPEIRLQILEALAHRVRTAEPDAAH